MKLNQPEEIVRTQVDFGALSSVRKVIVLKGYQNDGKTAILTDLIRQLCIKFPNAWFGRGNRTADKFDISKVAEYATITDSTAVFKINGVIVVVRTGGDNPSVMSDTFNVAARYKAQIVVTALKVEVNAMKKSRVLIAYEYIKKTLAFEEVVIDIRGKKFRKAQYVQEKKTAGEIVKVVEECISGLKHLREG